MNVAAEHDREDDQGGDGADIDQDLRHRQEFGLQQDEEAGDAEKGQDQPQGAAHQVLRQHDHQGRAQGDDGEDREQRLLRIPSPLRAR